MSITVIDYVDSIKYLGIANNSGNLAKFVNSEFVPTYLLKTFCIPLITRVLEATSLSNSNLARLDDVVNRAVIRIVTAWTLRTSSA